MALGDLGILALVGLSSRLGSVDPHRKETVMENVIRLLIVDDETRFLKAIAQRLTKRGFDVRTATNGPDAIALAKKEKFDIALLDLKMPGMDGGQVLRLLKEEHEFLEAIILTGHGSLESAVELTKIGAFSYLPKPYELEKLIEVLKDAYEARLKKKFEADQKKLERIMAAAEGESALGILRKLRELDDRRR
jgi:DNA-binding NtrC family response regulator